MLKRVGVALLLLLNEPAMGQVLWSWPSYTQVRHHRHARQRNRPPVVDCDKINEAARGLTPEEIFDAIRNKPRQQAVYDKCQKTKP